MLARVLHGLEDGVAGDSVEDDALDRLVADRLPVLQHLQDVPGDRFAFAIGVGGEDQPVGVLHRRGDIRRALLRLVVDFPEHGEIVRGIDGAVLGGQIANVAIGGKHLVIRAQVLVDGLGLGRRFDDDEVHLGRMAARVLAAGFNRGLAHVKAKIRRDGRRSAPSDRPAKRGWDIPEIAPGCQIAAR